MRCCGGTTTVGPIVMFSRVASLEDRRRGFPVEGGTAREGADIVKDNMKTDLPTESLTTYVVCCE